MARPERPKVGEILVRAGVIDKHQLQSALGEQRRWGRRLGTTLIKMGFVEETELVRALASQLDLPVATLEGKRIHPEVLGLVPAEMAEKHMVIPLFVQKEGTVNRLFVGMEDPGSLDILDELRFRSGMDVRAVLVGPSELAEAIDRYYRRDGETTPEDLASADDSNLDFEAVAPLEPNVPEGTEELARFFTHSDDEPELEIDETTSNDNAAAYLSEAELVDVSSAPAAVASPPDTAPAAPAIAATPPAEVPPSTPAPPASNQDAHPPEADITLETEVASPVGQEAPAQQAVRASQAVSAEVAYEARMRLILQAMSQLLIEKGILTRDELHTRVRDLQIAVEGSD